MPSPRVWSIADIATVAEYAGVPAEQCERIAKIMEFVETLPDADVEAACAFGTAQVCAPKPKVYEDSPLVIEARAG